MLVRLPALLRCLPELWGGGILVVAGKAKRGARTRSPSFMLSASPAPPAQPSGLLAPGPAGASAPAPAAPTDASPTKKKSLRHL